MFLVFTQTVLSRPRTTAEATIQLVSTFAAFHSIWPMLFGTHSQFDQSAINAMHYVAENCIVSDGRRGNSNEI